VFPSETDPLIAEVEVSFDAHERDRLTVAQQRPEVRFWLVPQPELWRRVKVSTSFWKVQGSLTRVSGRVLSVDHAADAAGM